MDPSHFFQTALPALARERSEVFGSTKARLAVLLRGEPTVGWTICFGDAETPVREGADRDAELVVSFTAEAFTGFLEGDLDVAEAAKRGEVAADGDVGLLARLGYLLQGADDSPRGGT